MFEKALRKSTEDENVVLEEAEALRKKGYSPEEIYDVLKNLHKNLIQDKDTAIVGEAMEEFSRFL